MQKYLELDAGRAMAEVRIPDNTPIGNDSAEPAVRTETAPSIARMGGLRPPRLLERARSGQLSFYDVYCLWREHGDEPGFDLAARLGADILSEHLRIARLLLGTPPYARDRNMARFADYLLGGTLDRPEATVPEWAITSETALTPAGR